MRQTAVLVGLCFWGATAFAADQGLLNLIMPDAKVLAGINVTTAMTSPLGQFLLVRRIPRFITAVGFDPRTDLTEVLFASAADPANPGGLALARGIFKLDQIVAAAATHTNLDVQTWDGYSLIVTTDPKSKVPHAVAFIDGTIAVAGDLPDVKAALDRSSAVNSIDPALGVEVNTLSTANDAWIVSSVGLPGKKLQAFKAIQSFEGGVKFGATVQAAGRAVADTSENAAALANVIRFLAKVPGLQATATGNTVNVSLSATEAQIEAAINAHAVPQQGRSSVQGQRRVR